MPLIRQNRYIKRWQMDLSGVTPSTFVNLVKELISQAGLKDTIQQDLNINYMGSQLTGDLAEVESLISQIDTTDDEPHNFNLNVLTNTNPQKTLMLSIAFIPGIVTLNTQNFARTEVNQLIEVIKQHIHLDESKKSPPIQADSSKSEEVYLPGPFRPIRIPKQSDKDVFVIMSFEKVLRDAYFIAIDPTLKRMGFNPVRVDQIQHNATVTPEIMRQIEKSVFVIADLTGERPNVYYEVGYAHRADKEVILLSKKGTAVHFDVAAINRIEYEDYTELTNALEQRVRGICERLGIRMPP